MTKLFSEPSNNLDDLLLDDLPTGEVERPSNYREALVGEGKKFRDDEYLARGKWESDNIFIPRLKKENQELREALRQKANLEQLVNQLREKSASSGLDTSDSERHDSDPGQNKNTLATGLSKEEIAALVKSVVTEEKTQDVRTRNIEKCVSDLKAQFGEAYVEIVRNRAQELGLSTDYMDNLAATSPKALLELVAPAVKQTDVRAPRSSVRSSLSSNQKTVTKDWNYYQELRRKDLGRFLSPEIQNEMDRAARSGELEIPSS